MGSRLEAPTLALADSVSTLLEDNDTPFFPAYTDHGVEHVSRVMRASVALIPPDVWRHFLGPTDASVLAVACLLHDLAMHIRPEGFVELVTTDRFSPVRWFTSSSNVGNPDLPWSVAWRDFQREARHFGHSQLELLLGPENEGVPRVAFADTLNPDAWTTGDYLVIGEFLRRSHARLGHEISLFGFPGVAELAPEFPESLRDAAGAVARSHGEPLRTMANYLEHRYETRVHPAGAALLYLMGLLRVADYLQMDADRAPTLLLRLKSPQSPQSVDEWMKHGAVSAISWRDEDPDAIRVTVNASHGLRTHLQLRELLHSLQAEMDTTTAVLSEVFGTEGLRLSRRRVVSNLDSPGLVDELPYVPTLAALRSGEDLFRLVVRDLYGDNPAVAGRELLQNAVDAVRERRRLAPELADIPAEPPFNGVAHVVVALTQESLETYVLRVTDCGVGMTPAIVRDYFLRAGASFGARHSELESLDPSTRVRAIKAGRFGIGALAAFLLAPRMLLRTQHIEAERGVQLEVAWDDDLVEMRWATAPLGTEVTVRFPRRVIEALEGRDGADPAQRLLAEIAGYYVLADPVLRFAFTALDGTVHGPPPTIVVPEPGEASMSPDWREAEVKGLDGVLWATSGAAGRRLGEVAHNGLAIRPPTLRSENRAYAWSTASCKDLLDTPFVAVFDQRHQLPLTLNRFGLVGATLPFERELLESIGVDLVAHALAAGDRRHPLGRGLFLTPIYGTEGWFPLLPGAITGLTDSEVLGIWGSRLTATSGRILTFARSEHAAAIGIKWTFAAEARDMRDIGAWGARSERLGIPGLEPLVSLYARIAREERGPSERIHRVARASERILRVDRVDSVSLEVEGAQQGMTEPVDPNPRLLEVAKRFFDSGGREEVILTLCKLSPTQPVCDELAGPWRRLVGDVLPRDRRRRKARSLTIGQSDPQLARAVAKWEAVLGASAEVRQSGEPAPGAPKRRFNLVPRAGVCPSCARAPREVQDS